MYISETPLTDFHDIFKLPYLGIDLKYDKDISFTTTIKKGFYNQTRLTRKKRTKLGARLVLHIIRIKSKQTLVTFEFNRKIGYVNKEVFFRDDLYKKCYKTIYSNISNYFTYLIDMDQKVRLPLILYK